MPLAVGDEFPDVELTDQRGAPMRLRGAGRPLLVVFFPAAFTPVCTGEWHALMTDDLDVDIVGISCDPVATLRHYAMTEGIAFPLLSDFWPHGEVARACDAFIEQRGIAGRTTYLVGSDGRIAAVWVHDPTVARDSMEYRAAIAALAG